MSKSLFVRGGALSALALALLFPALPVNAQDVPIREQFQREDRGGPALRGANRAEQPRRAAERRAQRAERRVERAATIRTETPARAIQRGGFGAGVVRDAARMEQARRSERQAERIDRRSERRADVVERRGDRRAERLEWQGRDRAAARVDRRSEREAQRIENRGDRRAYRVEQRGDRQAERIDNWRGNDRNDWRDGRNDWRDGRRDGWRDDRRGDWRDNRRDNWRGDRRDNWRDDRRELRRDRRNWARNDWRWNYRGWNGWDNRDFRRWNNGWRNDRRFGWHDWRRSNRFLFSPGPYFAPFRAHRYSRLQTGFFLDSLFFQPRFFINDPWQYRLPPVYGPYQWVRYYDDVLLVDIYTGEVVDVVHDFFW